MGNTVWLLNEDRLEDEWDHSLIIAYEKNLDDLAEELNISKLSDFYDHSILAEEYGGEVEPNFIEAENLSAVLYSIINAISNGKLDRNTELLEELEDCLNKTLDAKNQGLKVRLALVP